MKEVKVSIVVPIYNVERYLRQCLNSIVNQEFDDYEVILINDGSTDKSKIIAEEFQQKYEYIKLINKKNEGLGAARNTGIKYVSGEYVVFIDSDDYIVPTYIKDLYELVKDNNLDIGICTYEKLFEEKGVSKRINLDVDCSKIYSGIEILKILFKRKIGCYTWNKIYRTSLFSSNNIEFVEGRYYEDIVAAVKLISVSEKVMMLDKALYKYRVRKGNITSIKNEKSIKDLNYSIDKVNKYLKTNGVEDKVSDELINFNISYTLGGVGMLSVYSNFKTRVFYNYYDEYFKDAHLNYPVREVIKNKSIDRWVKRDFILLKLGIYPLKNKITIAKQNKFLR